jgi:Arabinose-binding domain of AraC transcription regulator, N-term
VILHSPVTVSVAFVHGMLSGVRARGESVDSFLADAGIDSELLERAGARVTADQYVALFQSLTDRLDDDLLGFLTRPMRRGSLALIVRSAANEDTLESAIRRAARTFGLLQSDMTLELVRAGSLAGVAHECYTFGEDTEVSETTTQTWLGGGLASVPVTPSPCRRISN